MPARRFVAVTALGAGVAASLVMPTAGPGQRSGAEPPCARITLGVWTPPLDWARAGHLDSATRIGEAVRRVRDSIFVSSSAAPGRDGMQWLEIDGARGLLLYPAWWPAGIMIRFRQQSLGDTLIGEATALVADLGATVSRAPARVVTRCDSKD
jgi:hypothetical protein